MGNPTILVIIVTYNAMHWVERCFDSLRKSTIVPDVFVVDNGSMDGTQQFIQKNYPEVRFTQSEENLGFGKANNIGLQYALDNNYDYAYLLNQDAWVMPDTFKKLIETSKKHSEYGVLSPMQMEADMESLDKNFLEHTIGRLREKEKFEQDSALGTLRDVYETEFVMAAHWLITKECIERVGGFSPTFSHYGEDDNYIQRVHYWGMKVGIVPSLRAVHDRAKRKDSLEKALYKTYVHALCAGSSPQKAWGWLFLYIWHILKQTIKFRKPTNMCYVFKLFGDVSMIGLNRKSSLTQKGAFLKINNKQ